MSDERAPTGGRLDATGGFLLRSFRDEGHLTTCMSIPWGDGDPSIGAKCQGAHDQAQRAGEAMYLDPESGLWVMTAAYLRGKGVCCGKGCRHCPFDRASQQQAGRACLRPASISNGDDI